jgi:hypothetical protein
VFKYVSQTERIFVKPRFPARYHRWRHMCRATAGYVPQKWQVARTSDLASRWHSSSDSSEFRVTGVSKAVSGRGFWGFNLPPPRLFFSYGLGCIALVWAARLVCRCNDLTTRAIRFWSDYSMAVTSLNDIQIYSKHCTHYANVMCFFLGSVCKIVTYNNCQLYKIFLVIHNTYIPRSLS